MKLTLTEPEIMRAIQYYLSTKILGSTIGNPEGWAVRIRWRGEYAEAEYLSKKPIPTLTDAVSEK
jgi:hypothetical protein